MFRISLKVGDSRLAETLNRLHKIGLQNWEVQRTDQSVVGNPSSSINGAQLAVEKKVVKVRRHKRTYTYNRNNRHPRDKGLQDAAIAIIREQGPAPFKLTDLLIKADQSGLTKATVFRGLRVEQREGNIVKLEPGTYQRTGKSFAAQVVGSMKQAS